LNGFFVVRTSEIDGERELGHVESAAAAMSDDASNDVSIRR
tara:strand:+ start:1968 stop:2090 length:123 start_codon:yes stop_codon:yes gene_type:complete